MSRIIQQNSSDCAVVSLQYLLATYYSKDLNHSELLSHFNLSDDGISIYDLVQALNHYKLDAKAYKSNNVRQFLSIPSILLLQKDANQIGHFVVLTKQEKRKMIVFDPFLGKEIKIRNNKLKSIYKGVFISINQKPIIKTKVQVKSLLVDNKKRLWLLGSETFQLILQFLFIGIVSLSLSKFNLNVLLILLVILLIMYVNHKFQYNIFKKLKTSINQIIKDKILNMLLYAKADYLEHFKASELQLRFIEMFNYRMILLSGKVSDLLSILVLLSGHIMLFLIAYKFGIFSLLYNLILFGLIIISCYG